MARGVETDGPHAGQQPEPVGNEDEEKQGRQQRERLADHVRADDAFEHVVEGFNDRLEDVLAATVGHEFHRPGSAAGEDEHDDRDDGRHDERVRENLADPARGFPGGKAFGVQGDLGQEVEHGEKRMGFFGDGDDNEDDDKPVSGNSVQRRMPEVGSLISGLLAWGERS